MGTVVLPPWVLHVVVPLLLYLLVPSSLPFATRVSLIQVFPRFIFRPKGYGKGGGQLTALYRALNRICLLTLDNFPGIRLLYRGIWRGGVRERSSETLKKRTTFDCRRVMLPFFQIYMYIPHPRQIDHRFLLHDLDSRADIYVPDLSDLLFIMLPGAMGAVYSLYDLGRVSWVGSVPYRYPAQHVTTASLGSR